MNKRYVKGRRKEYLLKHRLEKEGNIVLRTAGSHGFADLISVNKEKKEIYFIQVKAGKALTAGKRKELEEMWGWLSAPFKVKFIVL